jgi:WD40 repeat protein
MTRELLWSIIWSGYLRYGCFSPSSLKVAAIGFGETYNKQCQYIRVWSLTTGAMKEITHDFPMPYSCVLNAAGTRLLTNTSSFDTVIVWDVDSGTLLTTIAAKGRKLAFTFTSDDSKILVYNSAPSVAGIVYDAEIHVWDTETGGEIASFAALHFDRSVPAGDFISSGNSLMCAASTEQGMGVWDISAGTRLLQYSCRNFCSTCCFNADDSCVIGYFNSDKSLVCLRIIDGSTVFEVNAAPLRGMIFSHIRSTIFVWSPGNAQILEYDANTGARISHTDAYQDLIFKMFSTPHMTILM